MRSRSHFYTIFVAVSAAYVVGIVGTQLGQSLRFADFYMSILWATGTGADVMRRIAAPMVGGVVTSFVGELLVYPSIYFIWRSLKLEKGPLFPTGGGGGDVAVAHEAES